MVALPSINKAKLPKTYEAAKAALQKCVRIDECKDWKDKAAAMASYAKQAKDKALYKNAVRIAARANERCGQLLKQVEKGTGKHKQSGRSTPVLDRTTAADDAGLSDHERKTALRVANVPEDEFERQVESDNPPSVSELARQGIVTKPTYLGDRTPAEFQAATGLIGLADYIVRQADKLNLTLAIRGLSAKEHHQLRDTIKQALARLNDIDAALAELRYEQETAA